MKRYSATQFFSCLIEYFDQSVCGVLTVGHFGRVNNDREDVGQQNLYDITSIVNRRSLLEAVDQSLN